MSRPIIGITLDYVKEGSFSKRPHFALREHYFNAVIDAGGLPLAIPNNISLIDDYLSEIDALIVPGGDFGLDPSWYVEGEKPAFPASPRLEFDVKIIKRAVEKDVPLLGICAGMQIMAGAYGCRLSSKIQPYSMIQRNHLNEKPAEEYAHDVLIEANTQLSAIAGSKMPVNSRHTEGVVKLSDKVVLSGTSDDGIIEAIEVKGVKFALGVQWHPEYFRKDSNFALFTSLVKQASK